ncbi:MAG: hypothetical protein IJV01_01880 [Bacteroidales bacterium]|nr:hypothetical protein [Bacteroidales bacterium]
MKKILAIAISLLAFAAVANAQPRTIGIRAGYGAQLSYQHTMGGENFLEVNAGWSANAVAFTGTYDFILANEGNFNFYAGPGAYVGLANSDLFLGVAGQLGVEYNFDIPLTLSLDWIPVFNLIPGTAFGWQSIALGIRYRF